MVSGGATTRYVLDGVEVVEEFDSSGLWQARYVYEDGIDRPRCMDRADIDDVNGNANTTEVLRFYYHQQALGSVTELTQPTGAAVEWVTYDVYGQASLRDRNGTSIPQSAVGNPYLFTGRAYDPESGLYHYRARAYNPSVGRFLQRDPLEYHDGLNAHDYVDGDPATCADPNGLAVVGRRRTSVSQHAAAGDAGNRPAHGVRYGGGRGPHRRLPRVPPLSLDPYIPRPVHNARDMPGWTVWKAGKPGCDHVWEEWTHHSYGGTEWGALGQRVCSTVQRPE